MPSLPKQPRKKDNRPRKASGVQSTYNSVWARISTAYRVANPLCELCKYVGKLTDASPGDFKGVTDHIVRVAAGGHPRDAENFMTLCKDCHTRKSIAEGHGLSFEAMGNYGEMVPVSRLQVLDKLKRDVLKIKR